MMALFPALGAHELFWQRVEVHAREAESSGDACGHMSPDFGLSPVGFFSASADLSRYAIGLAV